MCFTIIEETKETLHSALGSSGRFLEGKKKRKGLLIMCTVTSNITAVFHRDAAL